MTDDRALDVRDVPKPQRHPLIFAAYAELSRGEALLLTNDHEPRHLREEFVRELAGSFAWDSLGESADGGWQVRIRKTTRTALPRIVSDTSRLLSGLEDARGGSVWQLDAAARDLDANIIALPAGDAIDTHDGPDLDVLILVLEGSGTLTTEADEISLTPGTLVWLPRRAQRRFEGGPEGLRYFSVHQRKPGLSITAKA